MADDVTVSRADLEAVLALAEADLEAILTEDDQSDEVIDRLRAAIAPPPPPWEPLATEVSIYCEAAGKSPSDPPARIHARQQLIDKRNRGFDAVPRRLP